MTKQQQEKLDTAMSAAVELASVPVSPQAVSAALVAVLEAVKACAVTTAKK